MNLLSPRCIAKGFTFSLLFFFLFVTAANAQNEVKRHPAFGGTKGKYVAAKQTLTYQIIPAEANTFGYDILSDNKKLIHQPSRPGLPGNKGFAKKQDAEKVAKLVVHKLAHNIMPPTVEKREMDSLKVSL